jgi:hypothetical protein
MMTCVALRPAGKPIATAALGMTFLLSAFSVAPAAARMTGIVGYSGQAGGLFCGNAGFGCHANGPGTTPPTVRFEGPLQVDPGAEVTYRFVLKSLAPADQFQAGFNVAASAGDLLVVSGQQEKLLTPIGGQRQELTHTGPKDIDSNDEAAWEFTWRAPATPGEYVLFGAGNSVDGSTTVDGDAAALTMIMVAVGDVAPTPTPTPSACAGDCNGNGSVAINELVSSVNISLGLAPVADCPACDTNHDGMVSVAELITAVNRALRGC